MGRHSVFRLTGSAFGIGIACCGTFLPFAFLVVCGASLWSRGGRRCADRFPLSLVSAFVNPAQSVFCSGAG